MELERSVNFINEKGDLDIHVWSRAVEEMSNEKQFATKIEMMSRAVLSMATRSESTNDKTIKSTSK